MATFLDDLSIYNAKASLAITQAGLDGDTGKANLMSSLKTTANDLTLSSAIRLNALTALINVGNLLEIALPPYFPIAVTYADTVTYVGIHNNLSGLQGGAPGEYYHLTAAERSEIIGKVSPSQLRFANLVDSPFDNAQLGSVLNGKQNALSGTGFVKINGTTISYDNSTYLTSVSGAAGGDLSGTYPNPAILSAVVMAKTMAGWNPSYPSGTGNISSSDTLLVAIQKLNVSLNGIVANPSGVSTVALNMLPDTIFDSSITPASGAVTLNSSLKSQDANKFLAAPNGTNGTPTFRVMVPDDVPNLGTSPAGIYGGGSPLQIPVITVDAKGRVTTVSLAAATGSGTVISVGIDPPAYIDAGAAVTTSGNISLAWQNTISPNYVLAGADDGETLGAPIFRPLVALDIPSITQDQVDNLSGDLASKLSGVLNTSLIYMGNGSGVAAQSVVAGDLTAVYSEPSNVNTATFTIKNQAVTYNKFAFIPDSSANLIRPILLGRFSENQGVMQQLTLSGDFTLNDITGEIGLLTPNPPALIDAGDLLTSSGANVLERLSLPIDYDTKGYLLVPYVGTTAPDIKLIWGEAGGDITYSINTDSTPYPEFIIGDGKVTLDKMADLGVDTIIGNNVALGVPKALSVTEVTAMLDQFTTSAKGLAPGVTGAAIGDATYFLNATGAWSVPAGGGGGGTVTSANQYSIPYYSVSPSGTTVIGLAPQTTNGVYFLRANVTASAAVAPSWQVATGTGDVVLATSPTLVTPTLGAALATSINGLTITSSTGTLTIANGSTLATSGAFSTTLTATAATTLTLPTTGTLATLAGSEALTNKTYNGLSVSASTGTLTITNAKTATVSNTLTFTGTDGSSVAFGAGGTVAYVDLANSWTSGIKQTFAPSATTAGINVGTLAGQPSSPVNGDIVYNSSATALQAYINGAWVSLGSGGGGGVTSFQTSLSGLTPSTATTGAVTLAGTLGVASGGTGATSLTAYAVLCGGTTSTGTVQSIASVGTAGQVLTSNGAGALPTFQTGGGSVALNSVLASTATATITHGNFTNTWNWNSNTTTNAFVLGSTGLTTASLFTLTHTTSALTGNLASFTSTGITSGNLLNLGISGSTAVSAENLVITNSSTANTSGRGLDISITGATNSGNTFGAFISNTKTGTTSTNTALSLTASGGTTNYALDVTAGIVRLAASTASLPHMIFSPGAAALTASTNGMLSYANVGSNSSFYLYKDSAVTTILTKDRNPDFVTSAQGVVVADASGNFTKSADLTALGIFTQTSTVPVTNTATSTTLLGTLIGSATLPASFFAVGKTIKIFVSGTYNQDLGSQDCALNLTIGGVAVGTITFTHTGSLTTVYYDAEFTLTCRTSGASGTLQFIGLGRLNHTTTALLNYFQVSSTSASINTTGTLAIDLQADWVTADPANSITASILTATYLN